MPNFALHELAHAYHDQCLDQGFSNAQVAERYREAKDSSKYEQVEQRFGDGRSTNTRAYAMSNPAEYFAESTEAYFSTNDFYPFTREQLEKHDPQMAELLGKLWSPSNP
jgi:Mlc titration factor MtfA (ptsG expression regulator)